VIIKKGDVILVLSGKDRAKTGKVLSISSKKHKAIVEGLNIAKKHLRPSRAHPQGGIIKFPAPIDLSNLKIICPRCNKATRIAFKKSNKKTAKMRICKKCKEAIDG